MPVRFDPVDLLRALLRYEVRFVVVGGVAGTLAGSPVVTRDLDVVYDDSDENLDRLLAALGELEARYRDPAGRRVAPDAAKLSTFRVSLLTTTQGELDLLRTIGDDLGYEALLPRTIEYDLGDLRVRAIKPRNADRDEGVREPCEGPLRTSLPSRARQASGGRRLVGVSAPPVAAAAALALRWRSAGGRVGRGARA
jgi:hypothetical protein